MEHEFGWFVGIDWADRLHEVCVIDTSGKNLARWSVSHSGDGLRALADRLAQTSHGQVERVAVGIEKPSGAVVETLLERGFAVHSLNPVQLDRFRDRVSPAGAKDDRRDAWVLAHSLLTDRHCFRRLTAAPADIVRLRELVRAEADLREQVRRHSNRLRALLHRYYPTVLTLSNAADEPWLWALLERAPTPAKGRRLRMRTLQKLLKRYRIRRFSALQLHQVLRADPLQLAPGTVEAASERVLLLIPQLQLAYEQLRDVEKRVAKVLADMAEDDDSNRDEHRDVTVLRSMPGVGRFVVATVLARAHRAIKDRDYHALRCQAGLAPVTISSGRSRRVQMRRACDVQLRNAFYHMARVASANDEAARAYYRQQRERGHSHGRALRALANRQLRILCAMLRDGTLYDPDQCQLTTRVPAKAA